MKRRKETYNVSVAVDWYAVGVEAGTASRSADHCGQIVTIHCWILVDKWVLVVAIRIYMCYVFFFSRRHQPRWHQRDSCPWSPCRWRTFATRSRRPQFFEFSVCLFVCLFVCEHREEFVRRAHREGRVAHRSPTTRPH